MDDNVYEKKNDSFQSHKNKVWTKRIGKTGKTSLNMILTVLSLLLVVVIVFFGAPRLLGKPEKKQR